MTRVRTEEESPRVLDLNGKTNLWQGERGATLAVAYAIMSAGVSSESFQHAATEVNLVYSRALHEDYALHVNLGHARDEIIDTRTTTWAFAVEHSGFGSMAPMAEMFGDDETGAWWNVGLRYTVVLERFFIDGSYGRQMTSNGLTLRTIGFTVAF